MKTDSKLTYAFIISLILHSSFILMPAENDIEPEQDAKQKKKMTISLKKAYAAPMPAPVVSKKTPKKHAEDKKIKRTKKVKKAVKPETTPIIEKKIEKELEKTPLEQAEPIANIDSEPTVSDPVTVINEPVAERIIQEQSKPKFDYAAYTSAVIDSVEENKSYPYLAKRKGQTGLVVIVADVGKDGCITDIRIDQSSGYSLLDKDAKKLVLSVFPMKNESGETLKITIPIRYMLN